MAQDLSPDQYDALIKDRPSGMSPEDATRKMVEKGYTFGGKTLDPQTLKPAAQSPQDKLAATGRAIEGTSDVGITPLGGSETIHDIAHAAAGAIENRAAATPGEGAIKGAAKKVVRGAAKTADFVQGLTPIGPEDMAVGAPAEAIATPIAKKAGQAAGAAWGAVKPSVSAVMSPIAERGILAARELGIPLTYAEFSQSKTAAQMDSLAKKIPFISGVMAKADLAKSAALNDARTGLLNSLGDSPGEQALGEKAKTEIGSRMDAVEAARQKRYGSLRSEASSGLNASDLPEQNTAAILASKATRDKSMANYRGALYGRADAALEDPTAAVPLTNLKAQAADVIASHGEGSAKSLRGKAYSVAKDYAKEDVGVAPKLDPNIQKMVDRAKSDPALLAKSSPEIQKMAAEEAKSGSMTPAQLREEISNLGDAADSFPNRRADGSYSKDGKRLIDMKKAAKADLDAHYAMASPESKRLYALADAFHGEYSDRMRNDTIARLYKEAPGQTFDSIVKSGDADLTGKLAAALGPDGKSVLKRRLFDSVFGTGTEIPDAKSVIKNLSDYGPGIRAVFKPAEVDALKKFALTGEAPAFIQSEFERTARSLIKSDPESLSQAILSGNADMAKAAKKYLPPATFKAYGRQLAENILASSPEPEVGFKGILKRLDDKKDVLSQFFDKNTIDGMKKIGDASQILPGFGDLAYRPPSSSGNAIAMGMWGIILHPSHLVVGGVGIGLIGAHQLAEIYTSDAGRKWITTMMRMSADDPRVPALAARGVQMAMHSLAIQPGVQKKVADAVGIK